MRNISHPDVPTFTTSAKSPLPYNLTYWHKHRKYMKE